MPDIPLVAIVDDDESHRRATQSLLRAAGFPRPFRGRRQLPRLRTSLESPCLVTDMRMPGMSGLELYQALVASGDGIPTVLVTAYTDEPHAGHWTPASRASWASPSPPMIFSSAYAGRYSGRSITSLTRKYALRQTSRPSASAQWTRDTVRRPADALVTMT